MEKLDLFDGKLLYELDKDSHLSTSVLAKKLKKSKQFVDYRIKRLEENKIISGYYPIIDASKLGFTTYRIYLKLQQLTKESEEQLINFLKEYENIWTIAHLHGKWDYAFFIGITKIKDLHDFWDKFMLKFRKYLKKYDFAFYSPIINFNKTFFAKKNWSVIERIYGDGEKIDYDETDLKIIKIHSKNVRTPLIKIAQQLNLSLNTIRYRIKNLEKKKIIVGYKLDINLEPLDYIGYRVDLNLISTEKNKQIHQFCKVNKNIYQIMKTIGGSDFEISVIVKNQYELLKLLEEMREQFKDVINDFEYFGFSVFPRLSFVPD